LIAQQTIGCNVFALLSSCVSLETWLAKSSASGADLWRQKIRREEIEEVIFDRMAELKRSEKKTAEVN